MKKYILVSGLIILLVCGSMLWLLLKYYKRADLIAEVYSNSMISYNPPIEFADIKVKDLAELNQSLIDHFSGYQIYVAANISENTIPTIIVLRDGAFDDTEFSKQDQDKLFQLIYTWHEKLPRNNRASKCGEAETCSPELTQLSKCLVPFSSGVCYHDLRKIDLCKIFYTEAPKLRQK